MQRFLFTFVLLGALWGLIETYLFISLTQTGISKQSLGISQSFATMTGIFAMFLHYKISLICNKNAE